MNTKTEFNVLIADDHELILQAMQKLISHLRPRLSSHLATNWSQLLAALEQDVSFDLAIIDYHMPGASLCTFISLSQTHPCLPVVVVSAEDSAEVIRTLFEQANIKGFIPKTDQAAVLLQALKLVLMGGKYVPELILNPASAQIEGAQLETTSAECDLINTELWGLSNRLQDVLKLLAQGLSNKMIARQLGISDLTVKTHVNLLFKQMGVKNRAEATALYLRQPHQ